MTGNVIFSFLLGHLVITATAISDHILFDVNPTTNITVSQGNKMELKCSFYGIYKTKVKWIKNGEVLSSSHAIILTSKSSLNSTFLIRSSLTINKATLKDKGRYRCISLSDIGYPAVTDSTVVLVAPTYKEEVFQSPRSVSVAIGRKLVLECFLNKLAFTSNAVIQWVKTNGHITMRAIYSTHKISVGSNLTLVSQLSIDSVQLEDQGRYKCIGSIARGYVVESDLARVQVTSPENVTITGIKQYVNNQQMYSLIYGNYHLALGSNIIWYHNDQPLNLRIPHYITEMDDLHFYLQIVGYSPDFLGNYTVRIEGTDISDDAELTLEQTTAQVTPQLINVHVGQPAKFECRGTGINITLSWRALQRHNISSKAHILNNQLIFPSVSMQDSNTYLCVVNSLNGNAFAFVDLNVKRRNKVKILDMQSRNRSHKGVLKAIRHVGDFVAKYSCAEITNDEDVNITWRRPNTSLSFPEGVQLYTRPGEAVLYWSRTLEVSDSGTYVCHQKLQEWEDSAYLELNVLPNKVSTEAEPVIGGEKQVVDSLTRIRQSPYLIPSISVGVILTFFISVGLTSFMLYIFCYKRRKLNGPTHSAKRKSSSQTSGIQIDWSGR